MPHTVYKKHLLTIDISARTRQVIATNTTFWTRDIETGKLAIHFVSKNQPVNLTDATVLLGFYFENGGSKLVDSKDGSVVIENAQQGHCHVVMPSFKFDYSGPVLIHVYIVYDNGKELDCATVATEFEKSWLDQELPEMEKYYVKRIEDWLTEIEDGTNKIKTDLELRLDELRKEISHAQNQANQIQEQINTNNIVTQDEFDRLKIGGRNLIENSSWLKGNGDRWAFENSPSHNPVWHQFIEGPRHTSAVTYWRTDRASATTRTFVVQSHEDNKILLPNTDYTLSGWYRINADVPLTHEENDVFVRMVGTVDHWRFRIDKQDPTGVWQYFEVTRNSDQHTNVTGFRFALGRNGSISLSQLKFERGNLATDWTLAVEDLTFQTDFNEHVENQLMHLLNGNAPTVTKLQTARQINGVNFDGTQNITITAAPSRIDIPTNANLNNFTAMGFYQGQDGATLSNAPSGITSAFSMMVQTRGSTISGIRWLTNSVASGRQWVQNFSNGTFNSWIEVPTQAGSTTFDMNVARAAQLQTAKTINGVSFNGTQNITVTANPTSTLLPDETNLNHLTTPGEYYNHANDRVATMINTPEARAFNLTVQENRANNVGVTQTFKIFTSGTGHRQWVRSLASGTTWGDWIEIPLAVGTARTFDMSVARANQLQTEVLVLASENLFTVAEGLSSGFHIVSLEANALNAPLSGTSFCGWINRFSSSQIMIQIEAGAGGDFAIYQIRKSDTWRGWRRISTDLLGTRDLDSISYSQELEDCKKEIEALKTVVAGLLKD